MRFRGRLFNLSTSSIDRTIQSSLMLMHHNLTPTHFGRVGHSILWYWSSVLGGEVPSSSSRSPAAVFPARADSAQQKPLHVCRCRNLQQETWIAMRHAPHGPAYFVGGEAHAKSSILLMPATTQQRRPTHNKYSSWPSDLSASAAEWSEVDPPEYELPDKIALTDIATVMPAIVR